MTRKQRPTKPVKLTENLIKALGPETDRYEVRDTELRGLKIRVTPAGVKTFCLVYRNGVGRQIRYTVGRYGNITLKQAQDLAKEVMGEVAGKKDPQETKRKARKVATMPTLEQFLDGAYGEWVTANRKDGKATVARLKSCFKADLITKKLDTITAWQVDKWVSGRRKAGRAASTINRDMAALKAMLAKAVEWDLLDAHPLAKIKPLKVDRHAITRYLKPAEETALRKALDARDRKLKQERATANAWRKKRGYTQLPDLQGFADHMKPMVLLSINTGIRRGELFQLLWSDVDLKQCMLTVRGATAKAAITRHISLNQEALDALKSWKGRDANPLVFPGRNGQPFDNVKKAWAALLVAAKVRAFRWHDLRHTFASKLVMAGVDLNTVRELLGHSDLKMTLRYAHLAPEHKADAVAKLVQS